MYSDALSEDFQELHLNFLLALKPSLSDQLCNYYTSIKLIQQYLLLNSNLFWAHSSLVLTFSCPFQVNQIFHFYSNVPMWLLFSIFSLIVIWINYTQNPFNSLILHFYKLLQLHWDLQRIIKVYKFLYIISRLRVILVMLR